MSPRGLLYSVVPLFLGTQACAQRAPAATAAAAEISCPAPDRSSRDILWGIVSQCLEPARAGYCDAARADCCVSPRETSAGRTACGEAPCERTTQVWRESVGLVAIRDRKMCGCPAGFVHGLAMPRSRVTGVEDLERRPPEIWDFAWRAAAERYPEFAAGPGDLELALVANPRPARSQDQLHVHMVRLQEGARERLRAASPAPETVASLAEVWAAVERLSAPLPGAYGVLVARSGGGSGYWVVVRPHVEGSDTNPEYEFTQARCR